jgi:type II secretory pathway pseudopilin PulG
MTRRGEDGYSLVALMAAVAIMLVAMTAAIPSWRYLMKNDREEELLQRGGEIADAIARYQRKNGNTLPPSLDVLVKGKFLRHAYKDPMTKSGQWRFIRPGEVLQALTPASGAGGPGATGLGGPALGSGAGSSGTRGGTGGAAAGAYQGGAGGPGSSFGAAPSSGAGTGSAFSQPGQTLGGFQGVASTSTDRSLRVFNGRTRYNEWVFLPGQPRVVGRPVGPAIPQPGGVRPPGTSTIQR